MFLLWHLKRRLEEKRSSSCACFFVPEKEAIKWVGVSPAWNQQHSMCVVGEVFLA